MAIRRAFGAAIGGWLAVASLAAAQCPAERIHSPKRWHYADFGGSVDIAGDMAIVGDRTDHTFGRSSGAVHVFRRTAGTWGLESTIFHSLISATDAFGAAISLDRPGRFAASAPGEDAVGFETGAVYIFEHDGEAWREVAEILPVEPLWTAGFGETLSLRGDTLVVGQPRYNVLYVFREREGQWEFAQKITPPDPRLGADFGEALALEGEWLAIGAPLDEEFSFKGGSVYLYRRQAGGDFEFVRKLHAPNPAEIALFGTSLDLQLPRLIIGAPFSGTGVSSAGPGAVFIHELVDGEWELAGEIRKVSSFRADFGHSVAQSGDVLVVGAPQEIVPESAGTAYVFKRQPDGSWREVARLLPAEFSAYFGESIATDGASVIVGAPGETVGGAPDTGAAHIFELACLLCRPDLDGDGELTFFDFLAFQNLFVAGDMTADFDGDGRLDFFDFLTFQDEFAAGCA